MSEKFNPLAEAEANASHDRKRFYDWIGDSSDHTDNEGFRAANEDMANYLRSRNDNGSLHDAENGQFMASPNNESDDDYYNRLQDDSETEGPFANASLKDLAEIVRDAKARGDKTMQLDARAAFDDKFMTMAEKYDWQGIVENADGTKTDRNAIADAKLVHYEAIMDGETSEVSTGSWQEDTQVDSQPQDTSTDQTATDQDAAATEAYDPKHRAENQDEDSPIFDELKQEFGQSKQSAHEGEILEEYEARQAGRHRDDSQDSSDGSETPFTTTDRDELREKLSADDLELLDEDGPEDQSSHNTLRDRLRRARNVATPSGLYSESYCMGSNSK